MSCRICHEEDNLIAPCSCSGSIKYTHRKCLLQWVKSSNRLDCEICRTKIAKYTHQISFKNLFQYGNYLVFIMICFCIQPIYLIFIGVFFSIFKDRSMVVFDYRNTPIMIGLSYYITGGVSVAFVLYGSSYFFRETQYTTIQLLDNLA